MFCKKCGSALPSDGYICKVCGTMMDQDQINEQNKKMKEEGFKKRLSIREKYGLKNNIVLNDEKDNSSLMGAVMILIFVFLIVLSVIIYFVTK
jgi:uncharacterized membrane protein YvbJ